MLIMVTTIIIIHKFTASAASRGRGWGWGGSRVARCYKIGKANTDLMSKTSHVTHDVNKCDVGACYTSLGFRCDANKRPEAPMMESSVKTRLRQLK